MNFEPVLKGAVASFFDPCATVFWETWGVLDFRISELFGSLRKSSEMIGNRRKMAENFLVIPNKIILAFLEPFLFLSG